MSRVGYITEDAIEKPTETFSGKPITLPFANYTQRMIANGVFVLIEPFCAVNIESEIAILQEELNEASSEDTYD